MPQASRGGPPKDVPAILRAIARTAAQLCDAAHAHIYRVEGDQLRLEAIHGSEPMRWIGQAIPITRELPSGCTVLDRRTIHLHDARMTTARRRYPGLRRLHSGIRTLLATPLLRDGVAVGLIIIRRTRVRPFTAKQIALLRTFADQAAITLENERLAQALASQNRELTEALERETATGEILRIISSSLTDVQPVLEAMVESATRLCDAAFGGMVRFDGQVMTLPVLSKASGEERAAADRTFPTPPSRGTSSGRSILERRVVHIHDVRDDPEYTATAIQRSTYRTVLAVPLLREGDPIGSLVMWRRDVKPFSQKQIDLMTTFADQAVIAIENVRLFTELEARNRELRVALEQQTATSELLKVIGRSTFDLQPVFETLAENAVRLCGAEQAFIFRSDGHLLRVVATQNASPELRAFFERTPIVPGRGSVAGRAALEGRTIHIEDVRTDPEYTWGARQVDPIRTVLTIPMLRGNEVLGVIGVNRHEVRAFTDSQIALLETFADQAAIAIENVRLFTELQARNRDLTESLEQQTATSEILRVISSSPTDVQPVFDTIVRSAVRLCDGLFGAVNMFDGEMVHRPAAYHNYTPDALAAVQRMYPMRPSQQQLTGRAILSRTAAHLPDVLNDPDYAIDVALAGGWRSALAVPMLRERHPIGTILVMREQTGPFSERQIELLKTFADQAVIAIENIRLFQELGARNRDLTETLEQQTATGEILRVISSSPTDVQPVFYTIAESVVRLCDGRFSGVYRFDGTLIHFVAHSGWTDEGLEAARRAYPRAPSRETQVATAILDRAVVEVRDFENDPGVPEVTRALARALGYRSDLVVPMLREGHPIGAIAVARAEAGPFSVNQVELLKTFADQAVIAIENVRLFQELEARNRDLTESLEQQTATGQILAAISASPTDVQPIFDAMCRSAVRLCDAVFSTVVEVAGEWLRLRASHGFEGAQLAAFQSIYPMPLSTEAPSAQAIREGAVLHIPDTEASSHRMFARERGFRSVVAVPVFREGQAIAAIAVGRALPGPFSDRQIALLRTFADQAVIAIENVRLFTELEARNRDLTEALEQQTATSEILRVISSSPTDVQPVFDTIAANALRLCGATWSAVTRFDGELMELASLHNVSDPTGVEALRRAFPRAPSRRGATDRAILTRAVTYIPDVREDPEYQLHELAQAAGYRSQLAVPMLREGRPVGAITVAGASPGAFSDRQVALLKIFADQAVIAIENVRLFQALEARNRDLTEALEQQTATSEILRAISSAQTDVQPVFEAIVQSAGRLCEAFFTCVIRFDGELLHMAAHHNFTPEALEVVRREFPMRPSPDNPSGRVILTGELVNVADILSAPEFRPALQGALGYRSVLIVPMQHDGRPIGAIVVTQREVRPFSEAQVALLRTFADQAVIAIENVRLFKELEARNRDLTEALEQQTATSEILRAISSSPSDVQPVFDAIVQSAVKLCDALMSAVFRFDGERLHFIAHHNFTEEGHEIARRLYPMVPSRDNVAARAVMERAVVHVRDIEADSDATSTREIMRVLGVRSVLAVPMLREGSAIGCITVSRAESPFSQKHIDLLRTFADQAVIAVENVRLFQELEARNHELTEALEQQTATSEVLKVISRSTFDLQPVLETLIESAVRLCGADWGLIVRQDRDLYRLVATFGMTPEAVELHKKYPMSLNRESATGRAVLERRVIHIHDAMADPEYRWAEAERGTILAAPMLREATVIGVIVLQRVEVQPFSDKQIELVTTFADQAVIAIENVRLFQELEARNHELTEALEQQTATSEVLTRFMRER